MSAASAPGLEIAVIGMSCHVPGAATLEAFWDNLREGRESISFFGEEELARAGVPPALARRPDYVAAAGVLADPARFDAAFFDYTPREAQLIDPQQRLFLERAWEALERAGYDPGRSGGTVGVFGSVSASTWLLALQQHPELWELALAHQTVLDKDYLATRVAYKLDLEGPAIVVQSACSSSLAAVHVAVQSLLAGECDLALAGGVSLVVPQETGYLHVVDGIRSRDGHCRAFDAAASGTLRGSGLGIVVLKRLADAVDDGDRVEAVIRASAMNNDGARKVGFTAPRVEGQARVVRAALALAGVAPETIGYVEAHGTGTALGDPIELAALTQAFGPAPRRGACAIGSVKTNLGHLDAASGVVGLIKAVLMLKHREIVPSLHFERPNPRLDLDTSPFHVPTRRSAWPGETGPRRAGVSSFGLGGTNVHVILEEAPAAAPAAPAPAPHLFVVSARTPSALARASTRLAEHLTRHPELDPASVAWTLLEGRRPFAHRRAVIASDVAEAVQRLGRPDALAGVVSDVAPAPALLFPGQGAQHPGMARGLYRAHSAFRRDFDESAALVAGLVGLDLAGLLFDASAEALAETRLTQPMVFAVEHALARLWSQRGIAPVAMLGHSVGEYVAACLAGVMSKPDALALVAARGELMQQCPRGAMLAIAAPLDRVRGWLDDGLALAAHNAPDACVVAGTAEAVERLRARLAGEDVLAARLQTSHAFHSPMLDGVVEAFAARVAAVRLAPPRIPFVSNLTGTWITAADAVDPRYWARHMRETVRFSDGLERLLEDPRRVVLEVGPGQALTALARRRLGQRAGRAVASMPHPSSGADEVVALEEAAARLWLAGLPLRWAGPKARRVELPSYPFEGDRYWVEPRAPRRAQPQTPVREPLERWLYAPAWRRKPSGLQAEVRGRHLCVLSADGVGDAVAARLRERGARVTVVRPGQAFAASGEADFEVAPGDGADFQRLIDALAAAGSLPLEFLQLWGLAPAGSDAERLERGFLATVGLARALAGRPDAARLLVATRGAFEVTGDEPLDPAGATVVGACRVIPQEYPQLSVRVADFAAAGDPDAVRVDAVVAEALAARAERVSAWRGPYRWVEAVERIEAPEPARSPLRDRGIYLLTGGLGRVALDVARYLASKHRARLVLVGRTGLSRPHGVAPEEPAARLASARERAVRELEAQGAEVLVQAADVADPVAMRHVVARSRERFGPLSGVIHAAGVPEATGPLATLTAADLAHQLRPKADGARVLADVLAGEALDFVLLTSSLAATLGGIGFAAYAAANQYLDTFALARRRAARVPWVSVNLDGWLAGPAPATPTRAISGSEGPVAIASALATGLAQVLVSTSDLEERRAAWVERPAEAETGARQEDVEARHARPELHTSYVAPEDADERALAELWGRLLGIDRVGANDSFFELGGNSLLAVQLVARIRTEQNAALSVATLFEAPTVRALAERVRLAREQGAGVGAVEEPARTGGGVAARIKSTRRTQDAGAD